MLKLNKTVTVLKLISLSIIIGVFSTAAHAQSTHQTATNLALGGGGTAYMGGFDANFINPANLMLDSGEKPPVSVGLIGNFSLMAGGSLANINVYNQYFTKGLDLSGSIGNEALTKLFGNSDANSKNLGAQIDFIPVGVSYQGKNWALGVAVRSRTLMDMSMSKGFAELGLFGLNGSVFSTPQAVNLSFEVNSFYEASVGYSRKVFESPELFGFGHNVKIYAGIAPKLLLGGFTSKMDFNSTLLLQGASPDQIDLIQNKFSYDFQTTGSIAKDLNNYYNARQSQPKAPNLGDYVGSPSASDFIGMNPNGFGVDLGTTIEMEIKVPFISSVLPGPQKLRVGASLTDIGSVNYSSNAGNFTGSGELSWKGFTLNQAVIDSKFGGSQSKYMNSVLKDSILNGQYGNFVPSSVKSISRQLPTMLNIGGQLVTKKISLSIDLNKGFTRLGTVSPRLSFSTGLEYRPIYFLPLRIGMRTGGFSATSYSAGFGLEFRNVQLDVAASLLHSSITNGASIGFAWSGLRILF